MRWLAAAAAAEEEEEEEFTQNRTRAGARFLTRWEEEGPLPSLISLIIADNLFLSLALPRQITLFPLLHRLTSLFPVNFSPALSQ